ncbi:MAG: TatD family hydrolase [Deltaproteobacteria bacterium]|nr:TatD family hydrolase [Deltaproteobacteria bacterium]
MRLFDSHAHLDDPRLLAQLDEVLQRARDAGVERVATIGCADSVQSVTRALEVARRAPDLLIASVGVHPHEASALDDAVLSALAEAAGDPQVVALGETGLDFHYDHSPRDAQERAFRRQVGLARELSLPLVVHTRSAPELTLRVLREEHAEEAGGIIHCFSEDADFARAALDLGFYCSFSGIVTFKSATAIQEAAQLVPADRLLIETDAPYLAPMPLRGKRNEPAFIAHTASFLAELRGESLDDLCGRSFDNACRVYGLSTQP